VLVEAVLHVVSAVASFPAARVWVAPPPAIAIVGYDAAAVIAALLLRRSVRGAIAVLAVASAAVLATTVPLPNGKLTITMLDVGQGDGIVVRTPRGHVLMMDTGGRLEHGGAPGGPSPAVRRPVVDRRRRLAFGVVTVRSAARRRQERRQRELNRHGAAVRGVPHALHRRCRLRDGAAATRARR
jgi:hypothetical protein